jgi:hypothetical protein
MMIGYDIYDRFTMKLFPLHQSVILTTSFFFARDSTYSHGHGISSHVVIQLTLAADFRRPLSTVLHDSKSAGNVKFLTLTLVKISLENGLAALILKCR